MSSAGNGAGGSGSFSALSITDNDFNRLAKFVQSNYGIDLSQKRQLITGRLSTPLKQRGYTSFTDFVNHVLQTKDNDLITLLLGITIAASMKAESFVNLQTVMIMGLGVLAFVFDTVAGCLFAKLMNLFSKHKINPMVGAAGISAFPMSSRVIQKMGLKEDPTNHLLMHAVGANVAGQIGSVIVGGVILGLVPGMLG